MTKDGRVYISRNVIFDENYFPYYDLFPDCSKSDLNSAADMHTDIVIPLYKENTVTELPIPSNSTTVTVDLDTTIEHDTASATEDSPVITNDSRNPILISGIEICSPITRTDSRTTNTHQMVTRSKARDHTPKALQTAINDLVNSLPKTVTQAIMCPH
ncbi:hypothetical protein PIB30_090132 [Stylosanthes scabra]|uniref:Uncharacterized protein n=1 Tax=Stylosanthes scabra TaxID=79078 RepID=A0ABU6RUM6_9FABA|nr:hypothetical protein [Stylosanthes scabra]